MSPLQTEAMNVQNCFISRHTPQVYNPSLFSPLFLYHSHHPRNKDLCQADIITIFTNICYRTISMLLLLLLSFCMYELVLTSPRKVNAWINVSELNRLNKWSVLYKKGMCSVCTFSFCAEHHMWQGAHCGGHMQLVQERQKRLFVFLEKRCGKSLGLWYLSVLLPHRSQRKGLAKSPHIKPEGQRRRRTEHQRASETRARRPKDVVASCEVSAHSKKFFQSKVSSENTACPSWEEKRAEGEVLSGLISESCCWMGIVCLTAVLQLVPFDLPSQKLPVETMFVPVLLRVGGHSPTCWLTWGQLVQSHLQPHISSSTGWGDSACALQPCQPSSTPCQWGSLLLVSEWWHSHCHTDTVPGPRGSPSSTHPSYLELKSEVSQSATSSYPVLAGC